MRKMCVKYIYPNGRLSTFEMTLEGDNPTLGDLRQACLEQIQRDETGEKVIREIMERMWAKQAPMVMCHSLGKDTTVTLESVIPIDVTGVVVYLGMRRKNP